jgi:hypothetical protein
MFPGAQPGINFADQQRAKPKRWRGLTPSAANSYMVHSTINAWLQRAIEEALQAGLWPLPGRTRFQSAEANCRNAQEQSRWTLVRLDAKTQPVARPHGTG